MSSKLELMSICLACLLTQACRQGMADQPRYTPLQASDFFEDGRSSRDLIPGTVARGRLRTDAHLYTGQVDGQFVDTFPFPITRKILDRGHERYDIFCSPCHDRVGAGEGIIVQRGFPQPVSLHIERLRESPHGYFYNVISNGFGRMYDYAERINPQDRWAIIAYIRALQLSQRATLADVPDTEHAHLEDSAS